MNFCLDKIHTGLAVNHYYKDRTLISIIKHLKRLNIKEEKYIMTLNNMINKKNKMQSISCLKDYLL
jgi:hypothetical protein